MGLKQGETTIKLKTHEVNIMSDVSEILDIDPEGFGDNVIHMSKIVNKIHGCGIKRNDNYTN